MRSGVGAKGYLQIFEIDKETGKVIDSFEDENVITLQGMNTIFLRGVFEDPNSEMLLGTFKLGIDTGHEEDPVSGWDVLNPRPAQKEYTSINQFIVYEVPEGDMVFDNPAQTTRQVSTLLDGQFILDTYFPQEVDLRYTSLTFRYLNDTTFAYKRFPVRSLSRLIDVQIVWTFVIETAEAHPQP